MFTFKPVHFLKMRKNIIKKVSILYNMKNREGHLREDGGRVRRRDHIPSHRYSRNTSTRGTAPTEHPLNAGRKRLT